MFTYKRADRVKELMLEEISAIIRNEVKDPRIGFVTITSVELAGNLRHAKVFVSPMGTEEQKKNTFKGICSATAFIRKQLGRKIRLKFLPEIAFKWDHSHEESDKVNQILHDLEKSSPDKQQ